MKNLGTTTQMGKWRVQTGFKEGAYTEKYTFFSTEPTRAKMWYEGIIVFGGGKKRLIDPNGNVALRELT